MILFTELGKVLRIQGFVHIGVKKQGEKQTIKFIWGVVAEWIRGPNSSSDASVQQSVGSNPGRDTCVPEQDT